jgi:hypothetical protein
MSVLASQSMSFSLRGTCTNLGLSRVALVCRYAYLIEEAVQTLNDGGDLLGQVASVHGAYSAASSKSRYLNGPSSEEMPARNAAATVGSGMRGFDRAIVYVLFLDRESRGR